MTARLAAYQQGARAHNEGGSAFGGKGTKVRVNYFPDRSTTQAIDSLARAQVLGRVRFESEEPHPTEPGMSTRTYVCTGEDSRR